ncbi:hypothetical protein T492DRAFT_934135 [Pavlovales sp. CCMP2436]|nr:hypothetical protein T492DRAFT_934135 [Pavlovales sp. CCMP2436]
MQTTAETNRPTKPKGPQAPMRDFDGPPTVGPPAVEWLSATAPPADASAAASLAPATSALDGPPTVGPPAVARESTTAAPADASVAVKSASGRHRLYQGSLRLLADRRTWAAVVFMQQDHLMLVAYRSDAQRLADTYGLNLAEQLRFAVGTMLAVGALAKVEGDSLTEAQFKLLANRLLCFYPGIGELQFSPYGVVKVPPSPFPTTLTPPTDARLRHNSTLGKAHPRAFRSSTTSCSRPARARQFAPTRIGLQRPQGRNS